ncbi:MAG: peptidoglycan DD-metalloendopeptidase family protein [Candidatus Caenarcaniphilales bacterium]|nr:peptidoglycan DD-metalloendopeptidase family protein [Candidatus Caenarcaniphilales bacterium]
MKQSAFPSNQTRNNRSFLSLFFVLLFLLNQATLIKADDRKGKSKDPELALNTYHNKLTEVKENAENIRKKVSTARNKERVALAQLQKTQRELYRIQSNYISTQRKLFNIERDIQSAQKGIQQIDSEVFSQTSQLKTNLRKIYIHKVDILASLAEALFESNSIVQFFNTLYYQRRLISYEMGFIKSIREKQQQLRELQVVWRKKQSDLSSVMEESEKLKQVVSLKKNEQYDLVDRLRKERLAYEAAERQLEKESSKLTRTILELSDGKGIDLKDLIQTYFNFPVRAAITSPFGYRMHPIFRVRSFHSGVDLGAHYGTPIKASNGGLIIYSGWYSGYGKTVIVSHGSGKSTLYAHMERVAVNNGEKVAQGQTVGYVGSTGYSTGPHLHFEYRLDGKPQNPLTVLR